MTRSVVYIAHPLNADTRTEIDANRAKASRWVSWAAFLGVAPVADWIILAGEWAETPENREKGLECDLSIIERCHELWMVGGRISTGMQLEATHAVSQDVRVRDFTPFGSEPPKAWTLLDAVTRSKIWHPK